MTPAYRLDVSTRKNGSFDYAVVEVATGKVIGTRNSRRQYRSATVIRGNLNWYLTNAREQLTWKGHGEVFMAGVRANIEKYETMKAAGEEFEAGVLSFNSAPTPPPSSYRHLDFLGYATRAE